MVTRIRSCAVNCHPDPADATAIFRDYAGARSRHPGGVDALLGDGSVRFIRDAIDPILEKISREGLDRLTPDERRLLEQASERLPDSSASKQ